MSAALRAHWSLDPAITFLNHGSFGACPTAVQGEQSRLRAELEREPVYFMVRALEPLLDAARGALGVFLGANPDDLVFVANATTGVNTVLRSLDFAAGDELLTTDHAYNACRNALDFVAERALARVVVAAVPLPIASPDEVVAAVLARVSPRTRFALLDHITSPTGIVMPIERLTAELQARGVDVLVDGAHGPGMVPLALDSLGAAYYAGNCHKWICAPKGAAFLHVRRDRQERIRPTVVSHGANSPRVGASGGRTRFRIEFDWTGTHDPTPFLCVPRALEFMASLTSGGWPEIMRRNRTQALAARRLLCDALRTEPLCPEEMIGALAAVTLPDGSPDALNPPLFIDPLQDALLERFHIEVPIVPWPAPPQRLVRVSAQLYNSVSDHARLAFALDELLRR